MNWSEVVDNDLDTLGYSLEMLQDDDTWLEVLDARANPDALSTTVYGLTSGKYYSFRVFSYNFNGASPTSDYFSVVSCGLPRNFNEPLYVESTSTYITVSWEPPFDDGGCPIYDYEM